MKPVPVVSDDELVAMLKACNGREFADRRDEALIRLLLDCGVRISEASACVLTTALPPSHLDALFLTQRGALSADGARDRVKLRGQLAGIEDIHPHRFRHTFAHDFLMSGGQGRDLKRLAGWSSDVMLES